MGFPSTLITDDYRYEWPQWFRVKYAETIHFNSDKKGPLKPFREAKSYGVWLTLSADIQRAINWDVFRDEYKFILVYLHECGGITRCQIEKNGIRWSEPVSWKETKDGVTHDYCYGCSDVGIATAQGDVCAK